MAGAWLEWAILWFDCVALGDERCWPGRSGAEPEPYWRLFREPAKVHPPTDRLSRILPLLVVRLEHHDWPIRRPVCGRTARLSIDDRAFGHSINSDRALVLRSLHL